MQVIVQIPGVLEILGVSIDYELTIRNLISYIEKLDIIKTDEDLLNCCKLAS